MGGHFWSFRNRFYFLCSKLDGLLVADERDFIQEFIREVQKEYFKLFPEDLKFEAGNKYFPGEAKRTDVRNMHPHSCCPYHRANRQFVQQIGFWLQNHLKDARNGRTPKYNGPPDELTEAKPKRASRAKKLDFSKANVKDLMRAIVYFSFCNKSNYTMPDFKEYQRLFWYKIRSIIQLDYDAHLKTPEEKHKSPLSFRNQRARELLALETDEVKAAVEVSRLRNTKGSSSSSDTSSEKSRFVLASTLL